MERIRSSYMGILPHPFATFSFRSWLKVYESSTVSSTRSFALRKSGGELAKFSVSRPRDLALASAVVDTSVGGGDR